MSKRTHRYTTIGILAVITILVSIWYLTSPLVTEAEKDTTPLIQTISSKTVPEKSVLINLNTNQLFLEKGTTTVAIINLVSQGKPSSYYETIGGEYTSDYKEPLHFSSIGHVYMPYSIHIFGNYFIHGIPYYPNGEKVSSTYSGGCIRLLDKDARLVYDFISTSTPIIITRGTFEDFTSTDTSTSTITSITMTRLMVATISLEFLTQDDEILDTDEISITTRRNLLGRLLSGDDSISTLYTENTGKELFIAYMNKKAKAIGLSNTIFTDIHAPAITTEEDYGRFMSYIVTYKSYLVGLGTSQ